MKSLKSKVDISFREPKVQSFLLDSIELCSRHGVSIHTELEGTIIEFTNWDWFHNLEVDSEGASLHWPRIQTDIIVQRKKKGE